VTLAVRAVFWVMAYLGVVVAPLVFAAIGAFSSSSAGPGR
jgi:hypothetical protein